MNTGETIALIKAFGGGGSSLPSVTSSDNGKVLGVVDGAWAAQQKKFVVTLTPTAPDYSGTMDKTVAEINAAYEAGQEIVIRMASGVSSYGEMQVTSQYDSSFQYRGFSGLFVANGYLALVTITATNDGTEDTYSTEIYALTPAS